MVITNSFSLQMLSGSVNMITTEIVSREDVLELLEKDVSIESYIGHADTANVISNILGISIPMNRGFFKFTGSKETIIVAQLTGGRLPEGATTIPEGMEIKWFLVTVE